MHAYLMLTQIQHTNVYCYTDIDECAEGTDRCAQNCHNNIGSYTCSCSIGYRLNFNQRDCNGKEKMTKLSLSQCTCVLDYEVAHSAIFEMSCPVFQ